MPTVPALPVELLRLIADNFRVPPFTSPRRTPALEKETRRTLCSLALASQSFRHIAQPLLFEFVPILDTNLDVLLKGSSTSLMSHTRTLAVTIAQGYEAHVRQLVAASTNLEEVVSWSRIRAEILAGPVLRRLALTGADLRQLGGSAIQFPELEILSLYDAELPFQGLDIAAFPSLQHFALEEAIYKKLTSSALATLESFARQVSSVALVVDHLEEVRRLAPSVKFESILVLTPSDYPLELWDERTDVVHVQLVSTDRFYAEDFADFFEPSESEAAGFGRLETIYLPRRDSIGHRFYHPEGNEFDQAECLDYFDRIVGACHRQKIEIVYVDQAKGNLGAERMISEHFMEKMTRKRLERAAREASER